MDDITAQTQNNSQPSNDDLNPYDNGQSQNQSILDPAPILPVADEPEQIVASPKVSAPEGAPFTQKISSETSPIPKVSSEDESIAVETPPVQEILPQQEIHKTPEVLKTTPTNQKQSSNTPQIQTILDTKLTDNEKSHIVDKRDHNEKLDRVSDHADEITVLADLEEEEFIREVEKHHES